MTAFAYRFRRGGFKNQPIRVKLLSVVVLNSSVALILAGAALIGYEESQYREQGTKELTALADVVIAASTAAVSFNDEPAAAETLAALSGDQRILQAALYGRRHRLLARYDRTRIEQRELPVQPHENMRIDSDSLLLIRPIRLDSERIGLLLLRSDRTPITNRLQRYLGMLLAVLTVSFLFSLLFGLRLLRIIICPVVGLAAAAAQVSREKNYGIRAQKQADDEVGMLVDAFNDMLAQTESYDAARRAAERSLRDSEERYALAARGANDGLWDWNLARQEIYFSPRWKQILGYSEQEFTGGPEEWFQQIHPADRARVKAEIAAHCDGSSAEFSSEHRIRHKNGSYVWVLTRGIVVLDGAGRPVRMAGSQTDITNGKVADPLTDLPNRVFLLDRLAASTEILQRQPAYRFALLFLDLDRFKLINDSLGHAAGDQLLMEIANRLRERVRPPHGLAASTVIARLGGDEFAILVEPVRGEEDALHVADQVIEAMSRPFFFEEHQMFANTSIGIAFSAAGQTSEDLLRNADTAMYQAKARGGNCAAVFDDGMREKAVGRMEMETSLRRAIAAQEFVVYYQPRMQLPSRRLAGFEALLRWRHPQRGLVSPAEFIPIAEETGLILPIGRWVLLEACRQMVEWQNEVAAAASLSVSVNVSLRELSQPGFADDVQEILASTGLPPGCLKLEITESSLMENIEATVATLEQLRTLQVGVEIDDFGTGYSSLSYLHHLPFDTLKVDRSFVSQLGRDTRSTEIVGTILKLAHSLGKQAVAEGIETQQQLSYLEILQCGCGQGYYFSKPLDSSAAREFLSRPDTIARVPAPLIHNESLDFLNSVHEGIHSYISSI